MLHRRHRAGGQDQPERVAQGAKDDRPAVAPAFGDGTEDRLADAPGEVLDGDGERELRARPTELFGDRNLEHAETRPDREAEHDDHAAADQDRRDEGGARFHVQLRKGPAPSPSRREGSNREL